MTEAPKELQYVLTREDASWLAGISSLPVALRRQALAKYGEQHGSEALINLFAQFMGLANSVVANQKEALVIFQMVDLGIWPETAEKLNLPTIFGACNGAMLADGVEQDGLCGGCAFRVGTLANQSPNTTCDADWCSHPGEDAFYCHEHPEGEEPSKACVGFARLRARRKRAEAA